MKPKSYCQRVYGPLLAKTFPNILNHWLSEEFPHLGGPRVRELFVTEVMRLIDTYYAVPRERLQPGQTVWYAVDKTDLPNGRSMAQTRLVPVILTLVARDDIQRLFQGAALFEVRRHIVARLHREADAQGGTLAGSDTGLLLSQHPSSISSAIRTYQQEHACVIPSRGTVHDLGRSVSHKSLIAKKAIQEGKQAPDVAWETSHSLASTERYLTDLMRVYISLRRHEMSPDETAFATGMSVSLVDEYAALIDELDLNDDQLPDIMAQLESTMRRRKGDDEGNSAAPDIASEPLSPE
jgi:hypothetical protein